MMDASPSSATQRPWKRCRRLPRRAGAFKLQARGPRQRGFFTPLLPQMKQGAVLI